jgi:hypothetical protein
VNIFLPSHFYYVYIYLGYFDLKLYLLLCIDTFYALQHFNRSMYVCFSKLCFISTDDERMWSKYVNKREIKKL